MAAELPEGGKFRLARPGAVGRVDAHDREAHGDSLAIVLDYPEVRGVFHCFSGSPEMAEELLKRGWYLGFDGPITYKNAQKAPEVAAVTPLDRFPESWETAAGRFPR
mgnify:CR=1 FL=1